MKKLLFFLLLLGLLTLTGCFSSLFPALQPTDLPETADPDAAETIPADPADDPTDGPVDDSAAAAPGFDFPYDPEKPVLMLTFDDGPNPTLTPYLVSELDARGVKATFFVLGQNARANHDAIDLIYSSGHDLCSHGYDHQKRLTELSDDELAYQLDETARILREITGHDPLYVRPPYGTIDRATAEKISTPIMLWTVDPRDWDVKDVETVKANILNNAYDGGVVICHDQYETTVEAVLEAVDVLLDAGWQFLTLSQYYQVIGVQPQPGQVFRGHKLLELE